MSTNVVDNSYQITTGSVNDLSRMAQQVIASALAERTKRTYFHYWNNFKNYCSSQGLLVNLPIQSPKLMNVLAHLFDSGYIINTIMSHVSVLTYIHKLFGFQDFSLNFLLKHF